MEEEWKLKVEEDMKVCMASRVRLEERDKAQQKDIDEQWKQISDLFDYKNDIYRKITENNASAAKVKDCLELAKAVTVLKTEKKFLPYFVMIITLIVTLASAIYAVNKFTRGEDVNKSRSQNEVNERLPVLRSEMPKDNQ
jgi:hypothetical protein